MKTYFVGIQNSSMYVFIRLTAKSCNVFGDDQFMWMFTRSY